MSRLMDRALAIRDRLLLDPAFHRFARKTPIFRAFSRREAGAAFDLCAGFVYSQILYASVSLGLLEALRKGPLDRQALVQRLGLAPEPARRLLMAAAALRLIEERSGNRFGLGIRGAAVLATPGVLDMIAHHNLLYRDLVDPVALLNGASGPTQLSQFWHYGQSNRSETLSGDDVAGYTDLMAASQATHAGIVLDAYPLTQHQTLLDIGGGDGSFLAAAARRAPHLDLMLFDLPAVAGRAATRLNAEGLGAKLKIAGGNFRHDKLPAGADIVTLNRILHDHDDPVAAALLASIRSILPRGGTLLIAEPMAEVRGAEAMGDAYFGFYLLALGTGRPRSAGEITGMLKQAGFSSVKSAKTHLPILTSLLVARA